jgi:hypothetical protein
LSVPLLLVCDFRRTRTSLSDVYVFLMLVEKLKFLYHLILLSGKTVSQLLYLDGITGHCPVLVW